jgi:crotonobetaine/carnitine-CoA ligase
MAPGVISHFPSRAEAVIAEFLDAQARDRPDRPCAVFPDETWTYADTARRAWSLAHGLIAARVSPGEPVAVWVPTGPELLQSWLGVNAAGAVYAPLHLAARGRFLEHALTLAGARVLIAHADLLERLRGLNLPALDVIVVVGRAAAGEPLPWRTVPFEQLLSAGGGERPRLPVATEPWDDFAIVYTSGTSGPSKGVRISYASHRLYADSLVLDDIGADDRLLMPLSMFHVAGTAATYAMLQRGGTVIFPGGFDASTFLSSVRRHRATFTFVLHGMVGLLLAQPPRADDRENPLRNVYMGPLARSHELRKRFDVNVYTGFGMTELPVVLRTPANPVSETTTGREFNPDFECRLVDEHDLPVPVGEPGELIVRHRQPWMVNSGYKDMPDATARAWRNGWFHTGDLLSVDSRGEYTFIDRAKDAIRRHGENISSYEVEAVVSDHPDVSEVAAVAVANPDVDAEAREEEVKIIVVPVAGRELDPADLIRFLVPRMPRHMVPRFIEIADELPRSPSFKVRKAELRAAGVGSRTFDGKRAGIDLRAAQGADGKPGSAA